MLIERQFSRVLELEFSSLCALLVVGPVEEKIESSNEIELWKTQEISGIYQNQKPLRLPSLC